MRFYYQTDVMGANCVKDDNQKIGVEADKLMGVQRTYFIYKI